MRCLRIVATEKLPATAYKSETVVGSASVGARRTYVRARRPWMSGAQESVTPSSDVCADVLRTHPAAHDWAETLVPLGRPVTSVVHTDVVGV
jgi:hypothetical protein